MAELPPSPKISPNAIMRLNTGAQRETPATRLVFWVFAINHVSTMLYTRLMTMPNTTGRAILK